MLSQYLEPLERCEEHNIKDTILVFDSARIKSREQAEALVVAARQTEGLEAAEKALHMSHYYEDARQLTYRRLLWLTKRKRTAYSSILSKDFRGGGDPGRPSSSQRSTRFS